MYKCILETGVLKLSVEFLVLVILVERWLVGISINSFSSLKKIGSLLKDLLSCSLWPFLDL